jgi:hypothetical protein
MRLLSTAAGHGIVLLFLTLVFSALMDAEGLRKQAESQPQGFERRLAVATTGPLARLSRALHLTTPRHAVQVAIGREHADETNTEVTVVAPPPARQLPHRPVADPPSRRPDKRGSSMPRQPIRVWVGGDSLAQVPGDALRRLGGAVDVIGIDSRLSTGLTRPDRYNWYTRFAEIIAHRKPHVVVLAFGADDAHSFMTGIPEGRSVGAFGGPTWVAEYRRRVAGVTHAFNAAGIQTVWLGLPIPDGPGFRRSFPVVNAILRSVAKTNAEGSRYIDVWHMLDSAHGSYTPYLRVHGKLTLLRLPDGVHYTAAAGDLIAAQVVQTLSAWQDLPRPSARRTAAGR